MSIKVSLTHRTTYQYDKKITLSPHVIRLRPAPHSRTQTLSYSLKVLPEDHFINWQQDPFGNYAVSEVIMVSDFIFIYINRPGIFLKISKSLMLSKAKYRHLATRSTPPMLLKNAL